jgi:hypothetical protein
MMKTQVARLRGCTITHHDGAVAAKRQVDRCAENTRSEQTF